MATRLVFVRHAEAEGNRIRRFHGWTDSDITEKGHLQAQRVAERLKEVNIDAIYSSSLKRAMQTAAYIAEVKNLPVIASDQLREINGGDWEDRTWRELEELWPDDYEVWENRPHEHKMPGGESMKEFQTRLLNEIMRIIRREEGKNICIVTHGTAIRAMLCHFRACTLEEMNNVAWCDNTAITIIDCDNGKFNVVAEGDATHLDGGLGTIVNQDWWIEYIKSRNNAKRSDDADTKTENK